MSFVTQGTVQVERKASEPKGEISVVITPVPDYGVKHKEKDYIVLISASGPKSLVFERTTPFRVTDDHIRDILTQAAVNRTKIEFEIEVNGKEIVAVKIPAIL